MMSDIEIAQAATMLPITEVAKQLNIKNEELEPYGHYKAKLSESIYQRLENAKEGKLVLVTAINPTPAGEGKTTTTVGLGQGMAKIGKKAIIALREPSLGPVFGVKGGAAGGGYAQVVPMEDINLHFTGDLHAVTAANNLLCCLIDNHLQQGNLMNIDPRRITFKRCLDMNDRAIRSIVIGLGGKPNGITRQDGFHITVASEVMAILCLATDIADLKNRLGSILVAYTFDNKPVFARDVKAEGAMTALLKDALKPNLIQTLEHTPALMHGGPFANIAHGCNSVRATKLGLKMADYCITEAGFGSDLGAEKFFDIKCRYAGLTPSAVVLVATLRALKYNGGVPKADVSKENLEALKAGMCNLEAHVENLRKFGIPVVVAINNFPTDTDAELEVLGEACKKMGVEYSLSMGFSKGGDGVTDLAEKVVKACDQPHEFKFLYDVNLSIKEKVNVIAKNIYGADGVVFTVDALKVIKEIEALGQDHLPICMAKTQYSFTDDQTKLGRPKGFEITVRDMRLAAGAGFIVVMTGDIMTMPGLPKVPSSNNIDVDEKGNIIGLF